MSLTETYNNGRLPNGLYYIRYKGYWGDETYQHLDYYRDGEWGNFNDVVEVLAKVPTYQKYTQMQARIKELTLAVKRKRQCLIKKN